MRGINAVLVEILRIQLWVVPFAAALLAALAAVIVVWADFDLGIELPGELDTDSARAVLSAISGAMISFTALVFSVTMLVLQLASEQLSPRVTRTFLRDRFNQSVLGLFVATFVFSLLTLIATGEGSVPSLGVAGAVILVLAAVFAFVVYLDHMAHAIRPTSVIESIGAETRAAIDRNYPRPDEGEGDVRMGAPPRPDARGGPPGSDAVHAGSGPQDSLARVLPESESGRVVTWSGRSGYVQAFDERRLLEFAGEYGHPVELSVAAGQYLIHGAPLLLVRGDAPGSVPASEVDLDKVVRVGSERTMTQDPRFGFRQLVDVALRALSPSTHDPTTAMQVVDQLHDLLRYLLDRPIDAPRVLTGEEGQVVLLPGPDWDAFVRAALVEVARAGAAFPEVGRHVRSVILDLERDADPERKASLARIGAAIAATGIDARPSP